MVGLRARVTALLAAATVTLGVGLAYAPAASARTGPAYAHSAHRDYAQGVHRHDARSTHRDYVHRAVHSTYHGYARRGHVSEGVRSSYRHDSYARPWSHSAARAAAHRSSTSDRSGWGSAPHHDDGTPNGLFDGLFGGRLSLVNTVNTSTSGLGGTVGGLLNTAGGLVGRSGEHSSAPHATHIGTTHRHVTTSRAGHPSPAVHRGSGSLPEPGTGSSSTTHKTRVTIAQPAPDDQPSLTSHAGPPTATLSPSAAPPPPTAPAATPGAGALEPVVPVTLTSAPSGWVLFLAVVLFALAVLFIVLGAGYRGRRER
jgi:hypothetical protein